MGKEMAKKGTIVTITIGVLLILTLLVGLYQYQTVQDEKNVVAVSETEEQKRESTLGGFDDETELVRYLFYQVQQDDLDLALRACAIDNLAENFLLRSYIEFTENYEGVNTLPPSDDESSAYIEISNARLAAYFTEQLQQCREIFGPDHEVKLLHVEEEVPENPDGKYYTDRQSICDILGSAKMREMRIDFEVDGQTKEMVWTLARYRKIWQVVSFNTIADGEKRPIKVLAAKADPDWEPLNLEEATEIPEVNYTVVAQNSEETPEELINRFILYLQREDVDSAMSYFTIYDRNQPAHTTAELLERQGQIAGQLQQFYYRFFFADQNKYAWYFRELGTRAKDVVKDLRSNQIVTLRVGGVWPWENQLDAPVDYQAVVGYKWTAYNMHFHLVNDNGWRIESMEWMD